MVLLFALALAPAASGAAAPMPDPVANAQPDPAAGQSRAVAARHQRIAVVATQRTATRLTADRQRAESHSSVSAGVLFAAGTLLLLFVGAAVSVLRLSVRMAGDTSARRLLRL
jgi:hypothetical protein